MHLQGPVFVQVPPAPSPDAPDVQGLAERIAVEERWLDGLINTVAGWQAEGACGDGGFGRGAAGHGGITQGCSLWREDQEPAGHMAGGRQSGAECGDGATCVGGSRADDKTRHNHCRCRVAERWLRKNRVLSRADLKEFDPGKIRIDGMRLRSCAKPVTFALCARFTVRGCRIVRARIRYGKAMAVGLSDRGKTIPCLSFRELEPEMTRVTEAIKARVSANNFDTTHVMSQAEVSALVALAGEAPTSFNQQNWRAIEVTRQRARPS